MADNTFEAARDEAAEAEKIYEPKYGGKDHSGYETMMKYEINYERMEAFTNGANWSRKWTLEHDSVVRGLVEALVTIECGLVTTGDTAKYAGFKPKEIAREALAAFEKARGEK